MHKISANVLKYLSNVKQFFYKEKKFQKIKYNVLYNLIRLDID